MEEHGKTKDTNEETNKTKVRSRFFKVIFGVLICCNIVALAFFIIISSERTGADVGTARMLGAAENVAFVEETDRTISKDMQHISINDGPRFTLPHGEGDLRIEISENCSYSYSLTYSLAETGETVLKTGLINPGEYVMSKRLNADLKGGEYAVIALFTAYDAKTQKPVGEAAQAMTFYVDE
ncbi:MAG: hypothetical protein RR058_06055 [Oscillospiraceae bacterium]